MRKKRVHRRDAESAEQIRDSHSASPDSPSRALGASAVSPVRLSPEKAGVLRIINASEEFGVAIPELAARVAGAGVHLREAAIQVAAAALCDLGEVVLAGEPPRYFGKKFRPQI